MRRRSYRLGMYSLLALCFQRPAIKEWYPRIGLLLRDAVASVTSEVKGAGGWDDVLARMEEWLMSSPKTDSIEAEFMALFCGPGRLLAPPYESVYVSGTRQVMGPAAISVLKAYREAGFLLKDAYHDCPDHIAAELEFMAHLCAQEMEAHEKGLQPLSRKYSALAQDFLEQHLSEWVSPFCQDIRFHARSTFWQIAADTIERFITDFSDTLSNRRKL